MSDKVVEPDTVVKLKMSMRLADGAVENSSDSAVLIGHEDILPALERALIGKKVGDKIEVKLEPVEAFGEFDPELIRQVPADTLGDNVEVGMKFEGIPGEPDDGRIYTVIDDTSEKTILLDGNHPLAGEAITFNIEILDIQTPTPEEIEEMEQQGTDFFEVSDITRT